MTALGAGQHLPKTGSNVKATKEPRQNLCWNTNMHVANRNASI